MLLAKDSKPSTSLEPKSVNPTISLDSVVHTRPSFIFISSKISSNYRHFDKQNSDWNIQNIEKMTNLFEKNKYSLQSKIGELIFDEMKIT
jgi:hypothetical protein